MKKFIQILALLIISVASFAQTNPTYNSIKLLGTDSTSATVLQDGRLWYNPVSHKFRAYVNGSKVTVYPGSGGGGGGGVSSVSGTTNRITSTGGATPVIDVSATFEALLSKVAQRIDQNNAATTSAQLQSTISDESGTGALLFAGGAIGAATATTPSAADDDTSVATTAFVHDEVVGVQDFPIPAAAMWPRSSNGSAPLANVREITTSLLNIVGLRFGVSGQEFAQCHFTLPRKWNNGTVTYHIKWAADVSAGTGNVRFGVQAAAYSNDDALTGAFGTEVAVTDAFIAADDLHITDVSGALTIAGTPQAGDLIAVQLNRDPDHASDTYTQGVVVLELTIYITTTKAIDE